MSEDQMSLPVFAVILLVSGLIIRYLFFSGGTAPQPSSSSLTAEAQVRFREMAVERIQQMFPQVERRTILWNLQRNGGSIQNTTERILAGRLEMPPITFRPQSPPNASPGTTTPGPGAKKPEMSKQPDLITRYNLKDRLDTAAIQAALEGRVDVSGKGGEAGEGGDGKGKGWSSNREERQVSLQRRRDEMILAARRKMEAKMAAEKVGAGQ